MVGRRPIGQPTLHRYQTGNEYAAPLNGKENLNQSEKLNNSLKALPNLKKRKSSRSKSKGKKSGRKTQAIPDNHEIQRRQHYESQEQDLGRETIFCNEMGRAV